MNRKYLLLFLVFTLMLCIFGCKPQRVYKAGGEVSLKLGETKPGERIELAASGVSFGMRYVPGGITFPMDFYDYGIMRLTMENAYWIAETEVTYELWKEVYDWAVSSKGKGKREGEGEYRFIHTGRQGGDASSDGRAVGNKFHPVTNISWRDALIWCNALTEWYNAEKGSSLTCVYYTDELYTQPLRVIDDADDYPCSITPGTQDNPYVKTDADGFRLPSRDEWVLAARYQGNNEVNSEEDFPGPYFTHGNSASGASCRILDAQATGRVAWYAKNSGGSTKPVGSAGTNGRKALTGNANYLGIYDMSGNVMEFSFDWYRPGEMNYCFRTVHNGSWAGTAGSQIINIRMNILPYEGNNFTGFRFAKTY